jgi:hypothetical protein
MASIQTEVPTIHGVRLRERIDGVYYARITLFDPNRLIVVNLKEKTVEVDGERIPLSENFLETELLRTKRFEYEGVPAKLSVYPAEDGYLLVITSYHKQEESE